MNSAEPLDPETKYIAWAPVLLVVVLVGYGGITATEDQAQSWSYFTSKDEMTGEVQAYATSPRTTATQTMDFPYRGVEGWLGFGCDGQSEWAFIGFDEQPNLTKTEPQSGNYSTFSTRVRWDDNVQTVRMRQEWGSRFLHFRSGAKAIANMRQASTVLVELNWYGAGNDQTYFRFTLNGSAKAIARARQRCQNL